MARPKKNPPGHVETILVDLTPEQSAALTEAIEETKHMPGIITVQSEPVVFTPEEISGEDLVFAYSVVNNNRVYQLVRIPLNRRTLATGVPEVIRESTDRYEITDALEYECDADFHMKDGL